MQQSLWEVSIKGIHTGNFSDIGVFSFNGNKIITTGGGGMLVTNKKSMLEKQNT